MPVQILHNDKDEMAALYCDTSEVAFGPIIRDGSSYEDWPEVWDVMACEDVAKKFLEWLKENGVNPRMIDDNELVNLFSEFSVDVENGVIDPE